MGVDEVAGVLKRTWYLGLTSFGGPAVHFQIFKRLFLEGRSFRGRLPTDSDGGGRRWMDETMFGELFALSQSLPGPASTKMLFVMALNRGGMLAAVLTLLCWSVPGATGMGLLAFGVSQLRDRALPGPVYALLSGLNASTVGLVFASAIQLARGTDSRLPTRAVVLVSGAAGILYNALWFFPLIVVAGGFFGFGMFLVEMRSKRKEEERQAAAAPVEEIELEATPLPDEDNVASTSASRSASHTSRKEGATSTTGLTEERQPQPEPLKPSWLTPWAGVAIIVFFFSLFLAIMVATSTLPAPPFALQLFRSMLLAGTIIFGGGPVVIPLLREFVVQPGWVTSRDFLLGLAIAQAFPGPNFNFAVYLGALALAPMAQATPSPGLLAFLAYVGIFLPGIMLATGFQPLWRAVRRVPWVAATLKGVNAAAVGLVFTATYRLWELGYLRPENEVGISLGREPWWVTVAAVSYAALGWAGMESWQVIILGAVMGMAWYGAVRPW